MYWPEEKQTWTQQAVKLELPPRGWGGGFDFGRALCPTYTQCVDGEMSAWSPRRMLDIRCHGLGDLPTPESGMEEMEPPGFQGTVPDYGTPQVVTTLAFSKCSRLSNSAPFISSITPGLRQ